jgi:hypothetical protein
MSWKQMLSYAVGLAALLFAMNASAQFSVEDLKAGKHKGELPQFSVEIEFSEGYGETLTNELGTWYSYFGYTFYEDKVYPEEYWGTYPLYFFGLPVDVKVHITNHGPRQTLKYTINTLAFILEPDGSNGAELKEPEAYDVVVEKGETVTIDASFTTDFTPGLEPGLDRFIILVQHTNNGGAGHGNPYPALILWEEGIFCPPEYEVEELWQYLE